MEKERKPKQKLVALTARHGEESYNTISDIAQEFDCSKAAVVRASSSGHLFEYFGNIRFYDKESTREIKEVFLDILKDTNKMRLDLNFMSNNLNQLAHYYNTKKLLDDANDELYEMKLKEANGDNLQDILIRSQEAKVQELKDKLIAISIDPDVDAMLEFKSNADAFMKKLDDKIMMLEDIIKLKGTHLDD